MTKYREDYIEGMVLDEISAYKEVLTYENNVDSYALQEILAQMTKEKIALYSISLAPIPDKADSYALSFVIKKTEENSSHLQILNQSNEGVLREDLSLFRISGLGTRGPEGAIQEIFAELRKNGINIEMYFAGEIEFEFYVNSEHHDLTHLLILRAIGITGGIKMSLSPTIE